MKMYLSGIFAGKPIIDRKDLHNIVATKSCKAQRWTTL